ncbi:MAG: cation transporter, partial [Clostridia bacterium]|nr:cation transporter [Clostridia bacterium]
MKTQRNILVAFILNLFFSIVEFVGGFLTGSVAIFSDSIHDLGDALCIGMSYFLEKKSKGKPDKQYTFGYARYSVVGGVITTLVLLVGSIFVIYTAITRIIHPVTIDYTKMIWFAVFGVVVNFAAAFMTREGDSLNQRAVNLHMLEDVLGWIIVLIGAIVMRFTDFAIIDPILSIGVAAFILLNAYRNLQAAMDVFLEKVPKDSNVDEIKEHVLGIEGVRDVHHIHLWGLDESHPFLTMHVVTDRNFADVKKEIREELEEHGIHHATLEMENVGEDCDHIHCEIEEVPAGHHHHHHHH